MCPSDVFSLSEFGADVFNLILHVNLDFILSSIGLSNNEHLIDHKT